MKRKQREKYKEYSVEKRELKTTKEEGRMNADGKKKKRLREAKIANKMQ